MHTVITLETVILILPAAFYVVQWNLVYDSHDTRGIELHHRDELRVGR